jgi:anti-anti-sigma regulatory factor
MPAIYQNPATHGEGESLYGIAVRESGGGLLVELCGEFDLFSLSDLRRRLNGVLELHRPTLVDLSGITFLDLASARELAVRSQLHADHLILHNPSPHVTASVEAFGLWGWVRLHSGAHHEEPPVFSQASR